MSHHRLICCFSALLINCAFAFNVRNVDVAIVGGGPGGLAAAIALRKVAKDASIAVFERDPILAWDGPRKGASIAISGKGWKAIKAIDAEAATRMVASGVPVTSVSLCGLEEAGESVGAAAGGGGGGGGGGRVRGLRILQALNFVMRAARLLPGLRKVSITRTHLWHDVRMVLVDRLKEICGEDTLRTGHRLVAFREVQNQENGGFELVFETDAGLPPPSSSFSSSFSSSSSTPTAAATPPTTVAVRARLVVAADGVRSTVRALSRDRNDTLQDEGKSVWRGVAPTLELDGRATFFRGVSGGGDAEQHGRPQPKKKRSGSDGRSALVFPAGAGAGASWTVISPSLAGRALDSDDARRRVLSTLPDPPASSSSSSSPVSSASFPLEQLRRAIAESPVVLEHKLAVRRDSDDDDDDDDASRSKCDSSRFLSGGGSSESSSSAPPPWESVHPGLCYLGDALCPVRPTGEGTALAWEGAYELADAVRRSSTATHAAAGETAPGGGGGGGGVVSVHAWRMYDAARVPRVRAISRKIRRAALAFYDDEEQNAGAGERKMKEDGSGRGGRVVSRITEPKPLKPTPL